MCRSDHLIAGFDPQRPHGHVKRVGPVGAGHAMTGIDGVGKFAFKAVDIGTANERAVANDGSNCGVDFRLDGLVLQMKISVGHSHRQQLSSRNPTRPRYLRANRRAGFPAYDPGTVISLVTTAPAPTTTSSQIVTGRTAAPDPFATPLPMIMDRHTPFPPPPGPPVH